MIYINCFDMGSCVDCAVHTPRVGEAGRVDALPVAHGRHVLEAVVVAAPALALAGDGGDDRGDVVAVLVGGAGGVVGVASLCARLEALPRMVVVRRPRRGGEECCHAQEDGDRLARRFVASHGSRHRALDL